MSQIFYLGPFMLFQKWCLQISFTNSAHNAYHLPGLCRVRLSPGSRLKRLKWLGVCGLKGIQDTLWTEYEIQKGVPTVEDG